MSWRRPVVVIAKALADDCLQEARNDYFGQYYRFTNVEVHKEDDPEFYKALGEWVDRPTLLSPPEVS
jgi:hypothetical protein